MKKKLIIGIFALVVIGIVTFIIVKGLLMPGKKLPPNTPGNPVVKTETKHIYPAYVKIQNEIKWGYIGDDGKFIINPKFSKAEDFMKNGLARVYSGEKVGLIDKNGSYILQPQFDYISDFSEGLAILKEGNTYKVIDDKTKTVFSSPYEINDFHNGAAICVKNSGEGKRIYGYIDKKGRTLFEPQFEYAFDFNTGKALAKIKEKEYVVIDKNGEIISRLNYNNIRDLSEDIMVFSDDKNKKSGYIKVDGQILIEPKFSRADKFENGYAVVNSADDYFDDKVGLINKKGEYTIKPEYADVFPMGEGLYYVGEKGSDPGMAPFGEKAIVSSEGSFITDFDYYDIGDFKDGYISVCDDKSTFFIDGKGKKASGLPVINGKGRMSVVGELIKAEVDEQLAYYTKDGRMVWQSENIYNLNNGAVVKEVKFKPDVYMLIYYPQISGHPDKTVEDKLNKKLKEVFVGKSTGSRKEDGKYVEDLNAGYEVTSVGNLLVMERSEYIYPFGAAHGMPFKEYYHININTGKFYSLEELFKKDSGYIKKLNTILTEIIKEKSEEPDAMIWLESFSGISASQSFIINDDRIQFFFQPYEIAAYAAGFPTFDIPYTKINDIIDREGDFWKSLKKNIM